MRDDPLTFVIRYGVQSRISELRRLEKRIQRELAAHFDGQLRSLREEASSSIFLSEQERAPAK
jgi:hypothetical protein